MVEQSEKKILDPATDAAEFDHEIYSQITVAARLRDIKLIKCEYSIKPEVFEALDDLENMGFFGSRLDFTSAAKKACCWAITSGRAKLNLGERRCSSFRLNT